MFKSVTATTEMLLSKQNNYRLNPVANEPIMLMDSEHYASY